VAQIKNCLVKKKIYRTVGDSHPVGALWIPKGPGDLVITLWFPSGPLNPLAILCILQKASESLEPPIRRHTLESTVVLRISETPSESLYVQSESL
jgi:hypothetical protein